MTLNRLAVMTLVLMLFCSTQGRAQQEEGQARPTFQVRVGSKVEEHVYQSDQQLEKIIEQLSRDGGGEIIFSAGVYIFERGIHLKDISNVHLIGRPGCIFRLRRMNEMGVTRISKETKVSSGVLICERPELLREGAWYQLFRPGLKGNRVLEFRVDAVKGQGVEFSGARAHQIKKTEPGFYLVPQLNFFDGYGCGEMSFVGIEFDGGVDVKNTKLGGDLFFGHTGHCGLLFRNRFKKRPADEKLILGITQNIRIERCRFRNLLGRAVAIYNVRGVVIRDTRFTSMGAECIEIDHLTHEVVISGCRFRDSKIGIRLNDCFEVSLNSSMFVDCNLGVVITDVLHDPLTNRWMSIDGNIFRGGYRGILVAKNARDNTISNNIFAGQKSVGVTIHGDMNICTGNRIYGNRKTAIEDFGKNNLVSNNLITEK